MAHVTPSADGISVDEDGTIIADGEAATRMYQLLALRVALKLEINTGMRMSKGSLLSTLNALGVTTKRTKRGAYADLDKYIVSLGGHSVPLPAAK